MKLHHFPWSGHAHRAPEGDVELSPYEAVRAWLRRVEALSGFVPFPETARDIALA